MTLILDSLYTNDNVEKQAITDNDLTLYNITYLWTQSLR